MRQSAIAPRLGIYWIIGEEIVAFAVPLDRAERAGGFANYPHGHVHLWPLVVRSHPRLRGLGYEAVPRGRVTYDAALGRCYLLVPPAYVSDGRVVEQLLVRFDLPPDRTVVLADAHYALPSEDDDGAGI